MPGLAVQIKCQKYKTPFGGSLAKWGGKPSFLRINNYLSVFLNLYSEIQIKLRVKILNRNCLLLPLLPKQLLTYSMKEQCSDELCTTFLLTSLCPHPPPTCSSSNKSCLFPCPRYTYILIAPLPFQMALLLTLCQVYLPAPKVCVWMPFLQEVILHFFLLSYRFSS